MIKKYSFILLEILFYIACDVPALSQNSPLKNDWFGETITWNDENGLRMEIMIEKSENQPFNISDNML